MNKTIGSYTIDTTELNSVLKHTKGKPVFVQLPEGFQQYTIEVKNWLEETYQIITILDANPNYGACDLPSEDILKQLKVQAVIQIGHFPIPSMNVERSIPFVFVNARSNLPISEVIEKSYSKLVGKRIGLVTTAQHIYQISRVKTLLEEQGYTVIIGKGDNRLFAAGQVLGCNFSAATSIADTVDSFLFLGTGLFHPLGLLLATDKPVIIADPYSNKIIDANKLQEKKQQLLRQRYGAIAFAKQAKTIAILIGLKPGQLRYQYALTLQKKIVTSGKKCLLLAADAILPSFTDRFPHVDIFVSTACPRIAIDDYTSYKKPILTPIELEIALQDKIWDDYLFDEISG